MNFSKLIINILSILYFTKYSKCETLNPKQLLEAVTDNSELSILGSDYSLLPDPNSMVKLLTNGNDTERYIFLQMYKSMLDRFDVEGYNWLMKRVMQTENSHRFMESKNKNINIMPHCDASVESSSAEISQDVDFPGGPIRSMFGFDLSKWITDLLMNVQTESSGTIPGVANMGVQSLLTVKGMIQAIVASVLDIVPPLIPPPIWILRPLPCLPMLTGMNCLGSVLYPITISDFITADVTDSTMSGVLSSFPTKYSQKVGKTSETQYRLCAAAYLGTYCASLFPICWLPIGLQEVQTFPVCFPQCLASLVACPGFWIEDVIGACESISLPPFCSFSIFINHKKIPPQYSSFEESHPFPEECPRYDPLYDNPDDLYDAILPKSFYDDLSKNETAPIMPQFPPLSKSLSDYSNVTSMENVQPPPCDCNKCKKLLKQGIPIYKKDQFDNVISTHEEAHNLTEQEFKCFQKCKEIEQTEKHKEIINMAELPRRISVLLSKKAMMDANVGHTIPIDGASSPNISKLSGH